MPRLAEEPPPDDEQIMLWGDEEVALEAIYPGQVHFALPLHPLDEVLESPLQIFDHQALVSQ